MLLMSSIVAFVIWLQGTYFNCYIFASILIIVVFILRIVRLLNKPRMAKKTHMGVWINGEYHPPGTYSFNDGIVRCGENGSVTVKGNRNVGNSVISG